MPGTTFDAYVPMTNTVAGVPGWPQNTTRYYHYDRANTCAATETTIAGLVTAIGAATTNAQKQALVDALINRTEPIPTVSPAAAWTARNCGAGPPGPDTGDSDDLANEYNIQTLEP